MHDVFRSSLFPILVGALSLWMTEDNRAPHVPFASPGEPAAASANAAGNHLEFSGPETVIKGDYVNHGRIKITDTTIRFTGTYTELGEYESDPSNNYFADWLIGTNGSVTAGTGDKFSVSGDFINGSLRNLTWNTVLSDLVFNGLSSHNVALAGADLGPVFAGYTQNFAWKSMKVSAGQALVLSDGNATSGAAIYVDHLILEGGLSQISTFTGNGCRIYYNPYETANAYLNGATYALSGGGAILPVDANLKITSNSRLPGGIQRIQVQGVALKQHRVQTSTDLITFSTVATITAAANGTFTYNDPSAGSVPKKFYRIMYP
jgi:hypothetical protein